MMDTTIQQQNKPLELTCNICEKIMTDAVLLPCCGKSYCKECKYNKKVCLWLYTNRILGITTTLEKTNTCPYCQNDNVTIDQIIPNKVLRAAIEIFLQEEQEEADRKQDGVENMDTDGEKEPMDTKEEEQEKASTEVKYILISLGESYL
jgi:glutaredoxin